VNTFSGCHSDVFVDYDRDLPANGPVSLDGRLVDSGELTGLVVKEAFGVRFDYEWVID
jgi:hypothetical protein